MTDWLTIDELAEKWRVTPDHVRGLIRTGQLTAIDISQQAGCKRQQLRIRPSDIEEFVNRRLVSARADTPPPTRRRRNGTRQWV